MLGRVSPKTPRERRESLAIPVGFGEGQSLGLDG
jgi:hypothetical protein